MPNGSVDPASLEGDDLDQWYRRSPWQVAQDRQALQRQQYNDFFGLHGTSSDASDSNFDQTGDDDADQPPDPVSAVSPPPSSPQPYFPVVGADGYTPGLLGDLRSLVPADGANPGVATNEPDDANPNSSQFAGAVDGSAPNSDQAANTSVPATHNALYDDGLARSEDGGAFSLVGNPANPRLRREWSQKKGLPWPRDPITGRNYHVAHIIAKADGGKDHVDNIRPMHPDDHMLSHLEDFRRWGLRPGIAKAFGGTVARSYGPLSIFSDILGIISGRIRHDNLDNFASDMMNTASQEDRQKSLEARQKAINANWKLGDPYIF